MKGKIRDWLFRHLFPQEYEHLTHLVDDVIRLENEKLKRDYDLYREDKR